MDCPNCGARYRIVTSGPISSKTRRYYCLCTSCGIKFVKFCSLESFIVKNANPLPPDELIQPQLVKARNRMFKILAGNVLKEKLAMKFNPRIAVPGE